MNIQLISFTERGEALARSLGDTLSGAAMRCSNPLSLAQWTQTHFDSADALIFVGAAGIAVRAVAPHVRSKASDPAVVVLDEQGKFAVSLLSGHLGGANALTRKIAALTGAVPVITTATDCNGVFAVDEWARRQDLVVKNPGAIKRISARLLAGETVRIRSEFPISGAPPAGVILTAEEDFDVLVSVRAPERDVLHLISRAAALGVGCKKGIDAAAIDAAFASLCRREGLCEQAVSGVFSIDRKQDEPGLLAFCGRHGWTLRTFSPEALRQAEGEFSASAFVLEQTGVDNVCERAAVLGSGGALWIGKYAENGVTLAVALARTSLDWSWADE